MSNLKKTEIEALLKLLDDPDEGVYNTAFEKLMNQGHDVIPELEKAWEQSFDEKIQDRLENLIQEIQINSTKRSLKKWAENGGKDLFKGAFFIAKYQYAELSYDYYHQ
ncbi:MAG: hypothetical protein ACQESJ_08890, partial [Bacteroidota bacterium]